MSGQSGHNLSVARSKRGPPRFPFEQEDIGYGYAAPGPISIRQMTPEEREKYGAPVEKKRKSSLTKAAIKWSVEHADSLKAAAQKLNVTARHLRHEMNRYCVPVPDNWEEDEIVDIVTTDDPQNNSTVISENTDQTKPEDRQDTNFGRYKTRLESAREKLNREAYQGLKAEGISDSRICKQCNIAPDVMVALKKEWGILLSEKKMEPKEPAAGSSMTIAQVLQLQGELAEDLFSVNRIMDDVDVISPRVKKLLEYYRDEYQRCLDRIEGVFITTEVAL